MGRAEGEHGGSTSAQLTVELTSAQSTDPTEQERIDKRLAETDLTKGVIGWDGQDDTSMPWNFTATRKWSIVASISAMTFLSPFSSTVVAPAADMVNHDLHNTNQQLTSFIVTVPVLASMIGAVLLGPMSEAIGRRPIFSISNWTFVIFNIACAVAPNIASLLVFRFFAGVGAAGCFTLIGGLCVDLFITEERGRAAAATSTGIILGPAFGPVLGGFVTERIGWRWIYWILVIASALTAAVMEICLRETYAPVIMARKVQRMSKELQRDDLRSCYDTRDSSEEKDDGHTSRPGSKIWSKLVNPFRMLTSPVIVAFCMYIALAYGLLYIFLTSMTTVYTDVYHWTPEITGLSYIGLGVGNIIGLVLLGYASDRVIIALKKKNNGHYCPEMRLPFMPLFGLCLPASLFLFGWSAQFAAHWIVPMLGLTLFGFGMMGIMLIAQLYMIDSFPLHASSAVAILNFTRAITGALLPLAAPSLYGKLGFGWGNSVLAFLSLLFAPLPWFFWSKGAALQKAYPVRVR